MSPLERLWRGERTVKLAYLFHLPGLYCPVRCLHARSFLPCLFSAPVVGLRGVAWLARFLFGLGLSLSLSQLRLVHTSASHSVALSALLPLATTSTTTTTAATAATAPRRKERV